MQNICLILPQKSIDVLYLVILLVNTNSMLSACFLAVQLEAGELNSLSLWYCMMRWFCTSVFPELYNLGYFQLSKQNQRNILFNFKSKKS